MVNRKGFTVVQLLVTAVIVGLLLIGLVAVPNLMRQTRNTSRTQDVHVLGLLIKEQQGISSTGKLPESCDSRQATCFTRDNSLSFYENTSDTESIISYYRNSKPFGETSLQLDLNDEDVVHRVVINSFAVCNGSVPTGENANPGSVTIQYVIETFSGTKLVCKNL